MKFIIPDFKTISKKKVVKKVEIGILLKISVKYSTISFYLLHTASSYFLEISLIQDISR